MKVVHYATQWLPQTATWLHNQVRFLPEDINSTVVCESTANLDQFPVPNIRSLKSRPLRGFFDRVLRRCGLRRQLAFARQQLRTVNPQILHSHFGHTGWRNVAAVRGLGIRHVVTFYGHDVHRMPAENPIWFARYRDLFERVDAVLCEGPHMAECIVQLGCPREKVRVHHLGVAIEDFRCRPRQRQQEEAFKVLLAASFVEKKGLPDALAAVGGVAHETALEITVIGDAPHPAYQPERQRILETIAEYGLEDRVRLLGFQPHRVFLDEAYRHHVFLSPSLSASDGNTEGGAPVSLIEAAATGMPIVSTRHCDIPEVVPHALLADERDVATLTAHLRFLINNPGSWEGLGRAGRRHVEEEFDATIQGIRLAEIYRGIGRGGGA